MSDIERLNPITTEATRARHDVAEHEDPDEDTPEPPGYFADTLRSVAATAEAYAVALRRTADTLRHLADDADALDRAGEP